MRRKLAVGNRPGASDGDYRALGSTVTDAAASCRIRATAGSTRMITPDRVRIADGRPIGVRPRIRAYITSAARYDPATDACSPSEYSTIDGSRSHVASHARATGNTTPPTSAAPTS